MKGFVYLAFYGMLASSLSVAQVNTLQDSKQVLTALKQLELAQLLEVQVTGQTAHCLDFATNQQTVCQHEVVSTPFMNNAHAATTTPEPH